MKPAFASLIVLLFVGLATPQQRDSFVESKFLLEFRHLDAINSLLSTNGVGKNAAVLAYGPGEQTVDRGNMIVLHRSFEVEITNCRDTGQLVNNIEASLKRRMENSGLKVHEVGKLGDEGFTLQYESACETGFTDIRALWKDEIFHMYFVFNETFCRTRAL